MWLRLSQVLAPQLFQQRCQWRLGSDQYLRSLRGWYSADRNPPSGDIVGIQASVQPFQNRLQWHAGNNQNRLVFGAFADVDASSAQPVVQLFRSGRLDGLAIQQRDEKRE